VPPWGELGAKTSGRLDLGDEQRDLVSGYRGPASELPRPRPGMHNRIASHVEAHAAAVLRQRHERVRKGAPGQAATPLAATLYINRDPCPTLSPRSPGCADALPKMLPEGARLTVWGPGGYGASFIGQPDYGGGQNTGRDDTDA
jgi:Double-stranded DNA deaminase toxin A